jgi:aryl-phospho-beta-D-glucosidase BglC (GH1 family)
LLAKTVNFGNALEAPKEGEWGMVLEERFFQLVKDGGFTAIRLPVKWSAHAAQSAPYTLEPTFLERVRWAVKQSTDRGLAIIVDFHHYDELMTAPAANLERFLGIWKQVAEAFKDAPSSVFFELHNEPNGAIEPLWNDYLAKALTVVRASNPTRAVVVGPNGLNSAWRLPELKLPDDPNLIVTFHNYEPFTFTHQGAEWINPVPPTGVTWPAPGAGLRAGWANYSWNTDVTSASDTALKITYKTGWAGLYLHSDAGASGYTALRLQTDRAVKLRITCMEKNQQTGNPPGIAVETAANTPLEVKLSACGNPGTLRDLFVQSNVGEAQPAYTLGSFELVKPGATLNLIGNARTGVTEYLDFAAAWSKANNRPLFMGEFGAYSKADLDSRVRWTTFTRAEAERRQITWGYWEFGAGFGVYDRRAAAWIEPLRNALVPR